VNTQQIIDRAEQHCNKQGSRLTSKRKPVLAGLLQADKALSAYELLDYCKNQCGANIPAMSAYRILTFLESEQLAHRLKLATINLSHRLLPRSAIVFELRAMPTSERNHH